MRLSTVWRALILLFRVYFFIFFVLLNFHRGSSQALGSILTVKKLTFNIITQYQQIQQHDEIGCGLLGFCTSASVLTPACTLNPQHHRAQWDYCHYVVFFRQHTYVSLFLLAVFWLSFGCLLAVCWMTVGWRLTDCWMSFGCLNVLVNMFASILWDIYLHFLLFNQI